MVIYIKKIFYHIILLFIIGGILGLIFESIEYLLKHGYLIDKRGLWICPLKPIYGIGLILLSLLYKIKDKNFILILLVGFIIGSIYEFVASLFQEYIFHTSTWDYKNKEFNIKGKIALSYSLIWALFTLIWLKFGLNIYLKLYNKIINFKNINIVFIFLAIILLIDITLTSLITIRYSERKRNIEATNYVDIYIDKYINNDDFEKKFPNLKVKT